MTEVVILNEQHKDNKIVKKSNAKS